MEQCERLKAWQACHQLTVEVYRATVHWQEKAPSLRAETRRAPLAASLAICRGAAREGQQAFVEELDHALSELARAGLLHRVARDLGLLSETESTALEITRDHARKLTGGLRASVRRSMEKKKGPVGGPSSS